MEKELLASKLATTIIIIITITVLVMLSALFLMQSDAFLTNANSHLGLNCVASVASVSFRSVAFVLKSILCNLH